MRPDRDVLAGAVRQYRAGRKPAGLWLGPSSAYGLLPHAQRQRSQEEAILLQVEEEMDRAPYLFASPEDGDPYAWLERLACYSPIIHLQQTSGRSSSHWPFTAERNAEGIIRPEQVLQAIAASYARRRRGGCRRAAATSISPWRNVTRTAEIPADIILALEESAAYWRRYVPRDGLPLADVLRGLGLQGDERDGVPSGGHMPR